MTNPPAITTVARNAVREQIALRALLDEVEAAFVRSPPRTGCGPDVVAARLDTLRGPLRAHFDEEERARLFETIEEHAPEHAAACARLRDEHRTLLSASTRCAWPPPWAARRRLGGRGAPLPGRRAQPRGPRGRAAAARARRGHARRGLKPHLRPVLCSWIRRSTTSGSASVVRSPRPSYSDDAILRRMRRMILPLRVFGRPDATWITSGAAKAPIAWRTCSLSAPATCSLSFAGVVGREQHVGVDPLALDRVREADDRGLGHRLVRDERALDLGGAQPVPRHVQHVVDAAGDPVVAVLVAPARRRP